MAANTSRRYTRFFRISLRTLLLLMMLAGVACGWIGILRQQSTRQAAAVAGVVEVVGEGLLIGGYSWPHELGDRRKRSHWERHGRQPVVMFDSGPYGGRRPRGRFVPVWLRRITGEECFHQVIAVNLNGESVADSDLVHLTVFHDLQALNLDAAELDPGGLQHVGTLRQLKRLCLGETAITDADLSVVANLTRLEELELWHTPLSDNGIAKLAQLKRLKRLNLCGTQVTSDGVNRLQQSLPDCKIWWDGCQAFRVISERSLMERNPLHIVRAVNYLHSLGKDETVLVLKEYTQVYEDEWLSFIVPLLFPCKRLSQPTSGTSKSPSGPSIDSKWPDSYSASLVQGDIPFYGGDITYDLDGPYAFVGFTITPEVVDWVAENCDIRHGSLHPANEPFTQASLLHAKIYKELESKHEFMRVALDGFLQMQAQRMVSHLDLENPEEAKLRWSHERQEYVLDDGPSQSRP